METQKRIVIVGGGFAGLHLARKLNKTGQEVWLIDRVNYHQFQPLLYQVAAARLDPASISFPLRKVFQKNKSVHIRLAEVQGIDALNKKLKTNIGPIAYDYLILATGAQTNYFNNALVEKNAFGMKSTTEAIQLRNQILASFERLEYITDPNEIDALMNIAIVGAGPTGVELAGALAEMKKNILPKDYPNKDFSGLNIYLIEGTPYTLSNMSSASQRKSRDYLEKMGVRILTETIVSNYDGKIIQFKNGEKLHAATLIWSAGIKAQPLEGIPEESIGKAGRIKVDAYNGVLGINNVFAVGDVAIMSTPKYPDGHPQLASVAIAQAQHLALNLKRLFKKTATDWLPFEYHNKGTMATIGKRKAVVDLPRFSFQGRLAWFFWMFLHLMLILSTQNKVMIFVRWAWSYFTNDTTLRLIILQRNSKVRLP